MTLETVQSPDENIDLDRRDGVPVHMPVDLLVPSLVHDEQYHAGLDRSHSDRADLRTDVRTCVAYSNNSCLLKADIIELLEVRIREFRSLAPLNLKEVCGQNVPPLSSG